MNTTKQTNSKLREALGQAKEIARLIYSTSDTGSSHEELSEKLVEIAHAALAEPVKNCEVGTAMEQGERFSAYCRAHKHPESECLPCPLFGQTGGYCELAWAQMHYEEGDEK